MAEPVNPKIHDEFVVLCSLFFSGEISEEEWALLQIHMGYCDICHDKFRQYEQLTSNVIPAMAAVAADEANGGTEESEASLDAAEQRLMAQLDFISTSPKSVAGRRFHWSQPGILAAVLAVVFVGLTTVFFLYLRHRPTKQEAQVVSVPQATLQTKPMVPDNGGQQALEDAQARIATLQEQLTAYKSRLDRFSEDAESLQKQIEAEQAARKQIDGDRQTLNQQLFAAQEEASALRNKQTVPGNDVAEQSMGMADLESKIRKLQASLDEKDIQLNEKDRMLALDKDFLAHDRDIRDLIGARNLYIADIFDTTENGRTAKQFGRIFYTKDRSLVFYGFDLDSQAGHRQDVSFQVWGSGSDRTSPVNLGLFYQDDTHKRWVLRCSDAKSLARLDMVFVTVEPPGGSNHPTGKPLLRAYLQIHPNHP